MYIKNVISLVMRECSVKWAWSGSREQFLHCGLRKFWHSKSSVYSWYPQHICGGFVHYTYKTVEVTRTRHSWVNMLNMHSPVQLSNFITLISSGLVVQVVSALLRSNWQDFNWHDACRGPSAIAELLVPAAILCAAFHTVSSARSLPNVVKIYKT